MREGLSLLHANLEKQRQAMQGDDLVAMSALVAEQQSLWSALLESTAGLTTLSPEEAQLLGELKDLVASNQLLAQQSLHFARRVLGALTGETPYGAQPLAAPTWSGKALDRRA
ncbi:MAG: hypothetical protein KGZ92_04900 [Firmicutes bacterium]|nr:hypothetical protein [Dethiobacter sp.]MBS3888624.1 hypothetical protein [Bacillota bacterium]MBS4054975.1 hypothetical protein [Thermaerobacter sp.]